MYNTNKETGGNRHHKFRPLTLWPCGQGCHNLLCIRCGASNDGCTLHKRQYCTSKWYAHWGCRRFTGPPGYQAEDCSLTCEEEERLQAAIAEARNVATTPAVLLSPQALTGQPQTALPIQPMALFYQPQMWPSPQLQADGTTLYPGETTVVPQEPLLDLQDPAPLLLGQAVWKGGSQCSTTASVALQQPYRDAMTGDALLRFTDPKTGDDWLCHRDQNDFVCWVVHYQEYLHPDIGVSQIAADSLAAGEIAWRAAADADHHAQIAHAAEMRATALALTTAEKAEADRLDKEATAGEAAATARAQHRKYEVAAAQANADAAHRARRNAIATQGVGAQSTADTVATAQPP